MRFRPANISLINRRHYLPRLLLILSSKRQMQKLPQRFEDVDRVTPYQGRVVIERCKAGEIRPDRCLPDPPVEVHDVGMIFLDEFGAPSKPVVGPRRRNIGEIIADGSSPVDDPHLCRTIEGGVLRVVNIRGDLAA